MNSIANTNFFACTVLLLALCGCGKSKLNTSELERAFQGADANLNAQPAADPTAAPATRVDVRPLFDHAMTAIKTNDYSAAIVSLETLRSEPTLTPGQLTAVQDTMAAVQAQLVAKANRGDPAAIRALEQQRTARRQMPR